MYKVLSNICNVPIHNLLSFTPDINLLEYTNKYIYHMFDDVVIYAIKSLNLLLLLLKQTKNLIIFIVMYYNSHR